jgi:3-oxoadipate CoA-transferase alpha subunit
MGRLVIYDSPAEAVADIPDGATIMLGGFSANLGAPKALLRALMDSNAAVNLTFIANGTPQLPPAAPGGPIVVFDVNRVRKVICSFPTGGWRGQAQSNPFETAFLDGSVELELVPQGTLAERIRAAGAGIPAFYTATGAGTVFAEGKEEREIDGRACVLERALSADYALVHALKADTLGNLVYRNTARSFNPPMAMAARVTIAEVDEIVEPGELTADEIVTPGIFVQRLVRLGRDGDG